MAPAPSAPIELRGILRDSAMRWRLDALELWQGVDCLGEVSAQWVAEMIAQRLHDIALLQGLQAEQRGDYVTAARLALGPRTASHTIPGKPPKAIREARRQARRRPSKRKRTHPAS